MNAHDVKKMPIIVVVGPTASGKTKLAIELAQQLDGEIISADSRQIYKKLNIGTGKPTLEQLRQVKHHLVSIVEPEQAVTAEAYSHMAEQALQQIQNDHKKCFLVGGTGLWIRSFVDGLAPVPPADPELRNELKQRAADEGIDNLYAQLKQLDPETAAMLFPADRIRVVRALEICLLTGQKASKLRQLKSSRPPLTTHWFGLSQPREELYSRAETKIDLWLEQGWLEEVKVLLQSGLSEEAPAMQAIGYAHLAKHLKGECSLERATELIKRDTRRYIKRQLTWFRADKRIHWLDSKETVAEIRQKVEAAFQL
jgi:tRNA dimethylallyltransferase